MGRGPKVRAAVLAATLAELYEVGYAGLSIDNVAQRAGVNKTTIYRRWGDRTTLIVDAIAERVATEIAMPDTGSVDRDLHELARLIVATLTGPTGRALTDVMIAAARVPAIEDVKRRFLADRIGRAEPLVRRAVERGELPAGTDPTELIKALIGPIYLWLLLTREGVAEAVADRAAAIALAAARAGVLGPRPA